MAKDMRGHKDINTDTWMWTCQFGEFHFKLSTRVHSLKTLSIRVGLGDNHQAKTLAGFLRCLPCLETLNTPSDDYSDSDLIDGEHREQKGSIDCLGHRLKYVKIDVFLGDGYDPGFAKFLVKNAQVLVVMSLLTKIGEETRLHELGMDNRASLELQSFGAFQFCPELQCFCRQQCPIIFRVSSCRCMS